MLLERSCPGCGRARAVVCAGCEARLRRPVRPIRLPGLDVAGSLFVYDELVQRLVLAGKNGARRDVLRLLARAMATSAFVAHMGPVDVVTWVPASRSAARRRGYDQGRILALAVADRIDVEACRLLVRRSRSAQAGRDRWSRLAGPELEARGRCPPRILLLDDVITTGASMTAAAQALRRGGSTAVIGLSVAIAGRDQRRAA